MIWGGLHGIWQVLSAATERTRALFVKRLKINDFCLKVIRVFVTFHLVCFGWIFFRANSLSDAVYIIGNLFGGMSLSATREPLGVSGFALAVLFIAVLLYVQLLQRARSGIQFLKTKSVAVRWFYYYLVIFAIIIFGIAEKSQFIYFQF